jgi:hypothetical protein
MKENKNCIRNFSEKPIPNQSSFSDETCKFQKRECVTIYILPANVVIYPFSNERNEPLFLIVRGDNQLWQMWSIFHSGLADGKIRINRTNHVTCGDQRTGHNVHDRGFSPVDSCDKMTVCSCLSELSLHATLKQSSLLRFKCFTDVHEICHLCSWTPGVYLEYLNNWPYLDQH